MGKRLITIIMAVVMMAAVTVSVGNISYADGNTADTDYSFDNSGTTGQTVYRSKYNSTRVYVHPTSGLEIYYTVYGCNNTYGNYETVNSKKVSIPIGVYASITNLVNYNGYSFARLKFNRKVNYSLNTYTVGVWSPDSTQNYTIYGD